MYFTELKYTGFLGAFPFLEQNCGIRNSKALPLIIGSSLKCFRRILTLSWQTKVWWHPSPALGGNQYMFSLFQWFEYMFQNYSCNSEINWLMFSGLSKRLSCPLYNTIKTHYQGRRILGGTKSCWIIWDLWETSLIYFFQVSGTVCMKHSFYWCYFLY